MKMSVTRASGWVVIYFSPVGKCETMRLFKVSPDKNDETTDMILNNCWVYPMNRTETKKKKKKILLTFSYK